MDLNLYFPNMPSSYDVEQRDSFILHVAFNDTSRDTGTLKVLGSSNTKFQSTDSNGRNYVSRLVTYEQRTSGIFFIIVLKGISESTCLILTF
jgi:hypothetical protein